MTAPLDLYGGFSGAFRCTATNSHFMARDLGSGENWYSLDLPVGVNIILMEADYFTSGAVNIDVGSIDGSEPSNRIAELSRLSGGLWQLSKTVAVTTPSRIRITLSLADATDIGKRITVFVTAIEPS